MVPLSVNRDDVRQREALALGRRHRAYTLCTTRAASMRTTRRAGRYAAAAETASSSPATIAIVAGSNAPTPNSSVDRSRVAGHAAAPPSIVPTTDSASPSRTTSRLVWPGVAPRTTLIAKLALTLLHGERDRAVQSDARPAAAQWPQTPQSATREAWTARAHRSGPDASRSAPASRWSSSERERWRARRTRSVPRRARSSRRVPWRATAFASAAGISAARRVRRAGIAGRRRRRRRSGGASAARERWRARDSENGRRRLRAGSSDRRTSGSR